MTSTGATIRQLIHDASQALAPVSPSAHLDATVLLAHALGRSRAALLADAASVPTPEQAARFHALLGRRLDEEPVAYLIGRREFYGLDFAVDRRVLVPRPDTEILVERALAWLAARGARHAPPVLADIGTGSGCVAAAVAAHAPLARIYAVDISAAALAVATANIASLGLAGRVTPLQGDGCQALPEPVDAILSNPPYTLLDEIDPGVRRHEPQLALDGGPDGLDAYRWLLPQARAALRRDGPTAVLLEIGAWQAAEVSALARASFPAAAISVWPDLAGRDRVVEILNPAA